MIIYVRSYKDLKAVKHAIETFYKLGHDFVIKTLGGKEKEKLEEKIENIKENDFVIVLLGREDKKYVNKDLDTATKKIIFFRTARVRNARLDEIFNTIELAKHKFILNVKYDENIDEYILGKSSNFLALEKGADVYRIIWKEFLCFLNKNLFGALIFHKHNEERVFYKTVEIARIYRSYESENKYLIFSDAYYEDTDIKKFFEINREYIKEKIEKTKTKIQSTLEKIDYDSIIVPWSGGKDSTSIILLLKDLGVNFTAIYISSGCDFEEIEEYIDYISSKLNIKYEKVEAPIYQKYKEHGSEYLIRRYCTIDKISTLYQFIENNFSKPVTIVGDRIPESRIRSLRPEISKDRFYVIYPLKYWSYLDLQLLYNYYQIDINKLYKYGFYRIGCKICPFLDSVEKDIIKFMRK